MKNLLLAVFVFCSFKSVFAQTDISITNVQLADTAEMNQTLPLALTFKNNSGVDFIGDIAAKATVQGAPISDLISASPLPISAGDSVQISSLSLLISVSNNFVLGDNVVVIWPVAYLPGDTTVGDTVQQKVYVKFPSGLSEAEYLDKLMLVYSSNGNYYLINNTGVAVSELSVFDMSGRLINQPDINAGVICLNGFAAGSYILKAGMHNGITAVFRLVLN